jgi:hypothetical protein
VSLGLLEFVSIPRRVAGCEVVGQECPTHTVQIPCFAPGFCLRGGGRPCRLALKSSESGPRGLKPGFYGAFAARLKPCPPKAVSFPKSDSAASSAFLASLGIAN